MRRTSIRPVDVELIPDTLEDGVLYISERYQIATHKCCCGCGEEVVTPLSPADWKLVRNGDNVSLSPSIGNWSFACRSHYFIRGNRVDWAGNMTRKQIEAVQALDKADKVAYIAEKNRLRENSANRPNFLVRQCRRLFKWLGL